jgi:hypothetical protein
MQEKFEIGDRVKVLNSNHGNPYNYAVNELGTVTAIRGAFQTALVMFDNDSVEEFVFMRDLEKIYEKFEIGDKVVICNSNHSNFFYDNGEEGVIISKFSDTNKYSVRFSDEYGDQADVPMQYLKKLTE